ncbi:MAG: hypothetical protein ACREC0_02280 [Methylocella sp.]
MINLVYIWIEPKLEGYEYTKLSNVEMAFPNNSILTSSIIRSVESHLNIIIQKTMIWKSALKDHLNRLSRDLSTKLETATEMNVDALAIFIGENMHVSISLVDKRTEKPGYKSGRFCSPSEGPQTRQNDPPRRDIDENLSMTRADPTELTIAPGDGEVASAGPAAEPRRDSAETRFLLRQLQGTRFIDSGEALDEKAAALCDQALQGGKVIEIEIGHSRGEGDPGSNRRILFPLCRSTERKS